MIDLNILKNLKYISIYWMFMHSHAVLDFTLIYSPFACSPSDFLSTPWRGTWSKRRILIWLSNESNAGQEMESSSRKDLMGSWDSWFHSDPNHPSTQSFFVPRELLITHIYIIIHIFLNNPLITPHILYFIYLWSNLNLYHSVKR
jgi:hypothetical protein